MHKDSLSPKIGLIQDAIELGKTLKFKYYAPGGNTEREMEPYFLIFKWSSLYIYGYCLLRNDYRMFKLNRMAELVHAGNFEKRSAVPMPDLSNEKVFPLRAKVKAVFHPSMKWHLIEEYGIESFAEMPDGNLLFEHDYADDEGLLSWILSCRDMVTVLEPESIREKLFRIASELAEKYRKEKKELIDEAINLMRKFSISGLEQRRITEVSGGQLQRACICRSMINRPEIIFADEPTGALNKSATEEVINALAALNREGTTILMVTHDSRMASRCGWILYLLDGQLQGELTLEDCPDDSHKQREDKVNQWLAKMEW